MLLLKSITTFLFIIIIMKILTYTISSQRLPKWQSGKESVCRCKRCKRHGFDPASRLGGGDLGGGNGSPLQLLPGKPLGQRSPAGYSLWGHKESDTT